VALAVAKALARCPDRAVRVAAREAAETLLDLVVGQAAASEITGSARLAGVAELAEAGVPSSGLVWLKVTCSFVTAFIGRLLLGASALCALLRSALLRRTLALALALGARCLARLLSAFVAFDVRSLGALGSAALTVVALGRDLARLGELAAAVRRPAGVVSAGSDQDSLQN
jgi:hypothetical protein